MSQASARTVTASRGGHWRAHNSVACCPAHEDRRTSLSLWNRPKRQFRVRCHAGCDYMLVLNTLRSLDIVGGYCIFAPPSLLELAWRRRVEEADAAKREGQARTCWEEALLIDDTPAEKYLRDRGLTSPLPPPLRFHPTCRHLSGKHQSNRGAGSVDKGSWMVKLPSLTSARERSYED